MVYRLIGPVAMGWGVTRQKVYNLILLITCQARDGKDSSDKDQVSKVFCLRAAINDSHISKRRRISLNGQPR